MTLNWQERRSLENSLAEFLSDQSSGVTVFYKGEEKPIDVRVGFSPRTDWNLPVISLYYNSKTAPRAFVGQNKRLKTHLIIIDIRALDDGMRQDIAEWVTDTINDGFDYYEYAPNNADPSSPIKTLAGKVAVEFLSDNKLFTDPNAEEFDKFRHNISINATIAI
jgi:hypothetical protein